jgi:hypothetical protein
MNRTMTVFVLGATLAVSLPAWAHTEEYFDSVEAPHGGQLRMAGPYHLELVAKDGELTLHVMDHADYKISTDGGMGKATIQNGKTKTQVKLQPTGDNTLKGAGDFSVKPESVVIVFIRLPDQEAYSARFAPLKPTNTPVKKHQHGKP